MAETEITFQVVESPEGGYEAWALGHNIVTEADDWKQLQRHLREAVQCHFPAAERPRLINLHFVRDEVIEVGGEDKESPILKFLDKSLDNLVKSVYHRHLG